MQARGWFSVFAVISATMLVSAQQIPPLRLFERAEEPPAPMVWTPHEGEPGEHIDRIMKEISGVPEFSWGQHIVGRVQRHSASAPGDGWVTVSQSEHDVVAGVMVTNCFGNSHSLTTVNMKLGDIRVSAWSDESRAVVRAWHAEDTTRVVTRSGGDLETEMASLLPEYIGVWVGALFQGGFDRVPMLGRMGPEITWTSVEREQPAGADGKAGFSPRLRITGTSAWGAVTLEFYARDQYTATFELSESPRRRYVLQTMPIETLVEPWLHSSPDEDAVEIDRLADLRAPAPRIGPGDDWTADLFVHWSTAGGWGIEPVCAKRDAPGLATDAVVVIMARVPEVMFQADEASMPTAVDYVLAQLDRAWQRLMRDPAALGVPVDPRTRQPVWRLAVAPVFVFNAPDAEAAALMERLARVTRSREGWHPELDTPGWTFNPDATIERFVSPNADAVAVFVRRSGVISRVLAVDTSMTTESVTRAIADTVWPWRETPDADGP